MRKNGIQRTPSAERLVWMLSIVIPQRLAWMRVAQDMVALQQKHPGLPGMKVAIEVGNGEFEHAYDGCLTTLTDNAISMAIFHGRSLLEFLGLGISPNRPPLLSAK